MVTDNFNYLLAIDFLFDVKKKMNEVEKNEVIREAYLEELFQNLKSLQLKLSINSNELNQNQDFLNQ